MAESARWNAASALAACPLVAWSGNVWRCHARRYAGDDAGGSIKVTGRFHRGQDRFPVAQTWPALYTSCAQHIALGERLRHTTPAVLSRLAEQRLSRLYVSLQYVLNGCSDTDCIEVGISGLRLVDLCHPVDYTLTHQVAEEMRRRGAEALLIPSCTRFQGGNLILFPDALKSGSSIHVEATEDPDLYIDWDRLASGSR